METVYVITSDNKEPIVCSTMDRAQAVTKALYVEDDIPYKIHTVPILGKKSPLPDAVVDFFNGPEKDRLVDAIIKLSAKDLISGLTLGEPENHEITV